MKQRIEELTQYLRGWRGYFGFCETPSVLEQLDSFLPEEWARYLVLRAVGTNMVSLPEYIKPEYQQEIWASATSVPRARPTSPRASFPGRARTRSRSSRTASSTPASACRSGSGGFGWDCGTTTCPAAQPAPGVECDIAADVPCTYGAVKCYCMNDQFYCN